MMENQSKMQCDKPIPAGYKLTEVGIIPEDWFVEPLTIITEPKRPISYGIVQTGPSVINGVPCIRVVDISNGKIQTDNLITTSEKISASYRRTILKKGDIVIPLRGKVGEIAIVDKYTHGANLTRGVALISLKKEYDSRYVRQYLSCKDSADRFLASMNGSALQEITIATLRRFPLARPNSLKEQIVIGKVLSDTDALITELEQLITKKHAIKTATMQQLLSGRTRLTQFTKESDGSLKGYKSSELGDIPEDWELEKIGSLLSITTGGKNTQDKIADGNYPFFVRSQTVEKINSFSFDCEGVLTAGDGVGTGKIFHYINGKFDFHQRVYLMFNFSDRLDGYFFYIFFSNNFYDRIMSMTAKSSVDSVRREMIADMVMLLPPKAEQIAIASILFDMDSELTALEQKLAKIRDIKQGMMQQLLTGRIRLPLEQQP
ncbi:TPA: restriction endonuclease subunit S [Klebsiella pneumoniae]